MDEVTEGTPIEDQPAEVTEAPPEGTSAEREESFTELDPSEAPEGEITSEWLQERYKQMQGDYTRKRQADAEAARERQEELEFLESLRSDPETQKAVFEQLQELLAESETDDEYETGEEPDELERVVQQLQAKEEEREAAQLASNIVSHIEQLAKNSNLELDEDDLSDIFNGAISGDEVNGKVTEAAFAKWQSRQTALHDRWQKKYLASKQAPTQLPAGQSAQDKPDLSTHEGRTRHMAAILQGGEA